MNWDKGFRDQFLKRVAGSMLEETVHLRERVVVLIE
jgi:hypothetical protein